MIHIPEEIYAELNRQIESIATELTDGSKRVEVTEEVGCYDITLTVELSASTSRLRFTDYAWGYTKSFIEENWKCEVEIVKVEVTDQDGNVERSDFDEDYIDHEYSSTQWI